MKVKLSDAIEDYKVSLIEIVASILSFRVRIDKEHIRAPDYGREHGSTGDDPRTREPAGN